MTLEQKRKWLLDFGNRHKYPNIAFRSTETGTAYAMGYGGVAVTWNMQVGAGSDDYVNAAYAYLQTDWQVTRLPLGWAE